MRRVLVAGATGYLGGHLVAALRREGYWVRALVRRPEQAARMTADDVYVGQVTEPETLRGAADGVDTVFSTVGITRQRDGVGYAEVDLGGNLALLREAQRSGSGRFVYVSVFDGPRLRSTVRLAQAKERFVDALEVAPIEHTVVRPTGFFSDMAAFLTMARRGRAFLVGDGQRRINPVSGDDLATACVEAALSGCREREVGGPEVFSHAQIVRTAAEVVGRRVRVRHIPERAARTALAALRASTPERVYGPAEFFLAVMTSDMVAPTCGSDRLADFFRTELAARR